MLHAIPSSDLHISLHLSSLSGHPSSSFFDLCQAPPTVAAEPASSSSSRPLEDLARRNQELVNENHRLSEVLNAALAARLAEATGSKATGSEATGTGSEAPPPPGPRQLVPSAKVKLMAPILPRTPTSCRSRSKAAARKNDRKGTERTAKRRKGRTKGTNGNSKRQRMTTTGSGTGVGEAGMTAATTVTMTQAVEALGPSVFELELIEVGEAGVMTVVSGNLPDNDPGSGGGLAVSV